MTIGEITKLASPLVVYEPQLLIDFPASYFFELRPGLLWLHWKDDAVLDVADFKSVMQFNTSYPHKHKLVMTLGQVAQITKEAREYDASHQPEIIKQATISTSLPQRIILNFMLRKRSSKHPIKIFGNLQKGIDWLEKDL